MLIKEYRIALPMSVDEYRIAQLYMIQRKSREESEGEGSGVEILVNEPYTNGPGGDGQYTYKIYHIGSHLPGWFRAILPKSALRVEEEAWNAYPYTKTRYKCPFVEKFLLEIETKYLNDGGEQENLFGMSSAELRQSTVDVLDIVKDPVGGSEYKKEEDPRLYKSIKTGRGPLNENWCEEYRERNKKAQSISGGTARSCIMSAYKLCKVEFRYWGMQSKIERFIHDIGLRKTMLRAHIQAWCWQDEWYGLQISDIRRLERETQLALAEKMAGANEEDDGQQSRISVPEVTQVETVETQDSKESPIKISLSISSDQIRVHKSMNNLSGGDRLSSAQLAAVRRESWGSRRSIEGSKQNLAERKAQSLEQLQESSSDEEFFDAQDMDAELEHSAHQLLRSTSMEIISSSADEYSDAISRSGFSLHSPPYSPLPVSPTAAPPSTPICKTSILFLVLHGGSLLETGQEQFSRPSDFGTLKSTFDSVMRAHYSSIYGHIAFRLVPCPQICTRTLKLMSSLSPFGFDGRSVGTGVPSASNPDAENTTAGGVTLMQEFIPLGAMSLFCSSNVEYQDYVNNVVNRANSIYQEFLKSDDGQGFIGQVCMIGDATGSLIAYDSLIRSNPQFNLAVNTHGSHSSLNEDIEDEDKQESFHRQDSSHTRSHPPVSFGASRQLSQSEKDLFCSNDNVADIPVANSNSVLQRSRTQSESERKCILKQRSKSDIVPPSCCDLRRQQSMKQSHLGVYDRNSSFISGGSGFGYSFHAPWMVSRLAADINEFPKLEFDVSELFMLGSPIALVLAFRQLYSGEDNQWPLFRPACHQVYNLFHARDPSSARLEPLICKKFKHLQPVKIPRYSRFPLGDGEPIHVVEAMQSHGSLFVDGFRHTASPSHSAALQRQGSVSSITSQASGIGDFLISSITQVTSQWWGNKRLDYALYCPDALHSFPLSALPHLFNGSFWESTDMASFILRQVVRFEHFADNDGLDIGKEGMTGFTPTQPREKWLRRRTTIKVKNLAPNHRANDVIVLEDTAQVFPAKFMYGSLDMTALTGEKVDVHIMTQPPNGEWVYFGTEVTDSHGRLTFTVPEENRLSQGMYPVKIIVRGDHTSADFFLTVLPPKTETVVFSVDGSFTASVSIMGKDPKVRAGAVDVVRHWQELGYLILYVTARPDMQHKKVVAWLAQHNFPHGMVMFMDGISKDPLRQKYNNLKGLLTEAKLDYKAGYGSAKDISMYRDLGIPCNNIYIVSKASKKQHMQAEILSEGYAAHLTDLMSPGGSRPAVGNARLFIRKSCFSLPSHVDSKRLTRGARSFKHATSIDVPRTDSQDCAVHDGIGVSIAGNTILEPTQLNIGKAARARGTSPRPKLSSYFSK